MPFLKEHFSDFGVSERLYDHGFGNKKSARFLYGAFSVVRPLLNPVTYDSRLYDRSNNLIKENKNINTTLTVHHDRLRNSVFCVIKSKGIVVFQIDSSRIAAFDMVLGTQLWDQRIGTDAPQPTSIISIGYDSRRNKIHVRYRTTTYTINPDGSDLTELPSTERNKHGLYFEKEDLWFNNISTSQMAKVNGETGDIIATTALSSANLLPIRVIKDKYLCFLVRYTSLTNYIALYDTDLNRVIHESTGSYNDFVYANITDDLTKMVRVSQTITLPTGQTEHRGTLTIYVRSVDIENGTTSPLYSRSPAFTYGTSSGGSVYAGCALLDDYRLAYFQSSNSNRIVAYIEIVDLNDLSNILYSSRNIDDPLYNVYFVYPTSQ